MTRMKLGTALLALSLAMGGATAGAQAYDSLRASADQLLNEYGYDIDADLLTNDQLAEFQRLDGDLESLSSAEARTRIEGVLMGSEVTGSFVSDPGGDRAWTSLRANADQLLNEYGYDVDPELLSDSQLAQFHRLDGDLQDLSSAEARTRIEGVLMNDVFTATLVSAPGDAAWTSLRASADQLLNQHGFDVDPALLSNPQLADFHRLDGDLQNLSSAEARSRIEGVLMDNEATAVYVRN